MLHIGMVAELVATEISRRLFHPVHVDRFMRLTFRHVNFLAVFMGNDQVWITNIIILNKSEM